MNRKWPWVFLIISIALIAAGLRFGEFRAVLEKARTVCLACIGIG